jgi:hypothetical protein
LPCNPPPQDSDAPVGRKSKRASGIRRRFEAELSGINQNRLPRGSAAITATAAAREIGAVVEIVRPIVEFPVPAPTCAGLKVHAVSAGRLEQAKVTLLGNVPVVGATLRLKLADCPAGADPLVGVIPIVKSKPWAGIAVKLTAAECEIAAGSLPTPVTLKL